jgi:murein DD-endopeptidase MepM/ murein hydrolase activator NlpD
MSRILRAAALTVLLLGSTAFTAIDRSPVTGLTLGPAAGYVAPGATERLDGRLTADGSGVGGAALRIDRLISGRWAAWSATRTRADGTYTLTARPDRTASYRVRFAGTGGLPSAQSGRVTVNVMRYAFPVRGPTSYAHTHALYPATDLFAACGTPVVSPVDGVVLEVNRVDRFDPANPRGAWKGGRFVAIRGDDGVRHYGAHFRWISGDLRPGVRVRAGQPIARVGHTGNASGICHLHYALSPVCAGVGDWWLRRGIVYPWPYLDAWRAGGWKSPRGAVVDWQHRHGCPSHP